LKISLNWIKDYITLPQDITLSKLAYDLTMSTVEVEEIHDLSLQFEDMAVGVVREVLPHPDADKLVVCTVDVGDRDGGGTDACDAGEAILRQIVCGGINVAEGMKVAVARPGSKVRWHGEGDLVELKKVKVRGVESYGMICSSSEIGLFDLFPYTDEATIMDISEFEANAGTPLAKALGLDDIILEIDNKSLTNRPDLWGHYGIAREISAIYGLELKEISPYDARAKTDLIPKSNREAFQITIADPELCPRYIGIRIEGISINPAPFHIQSRIWRVGMRPINAIVDITNYVMLATGQPTHAFDADIVSGNINIRRAKDKEDLLLLDKTKLSLTPDDLVIADEKEAIALAGVMGGEKDSILQSTKNVILEVANFNALSVRRTSMRFDVRTGAATRFEKGIDPERADIALSVAMDMFSAFFPNMEVTGYHDNYPNKLQQKEIFVSHSWLEKRLGMKMSRDYITRLLERLGFEVSFDLNVPDCANAAAADPGGDLMRVLTPTWRSTGDVGIPDDIVEEVARIHGLENFEPAPIVTAFSRAINQPEIEIDRKIREYLAFRCGMNEIYSYPWVADEYISAVFGSEALISGADMLKMSSPPAPNERFLRSSLLPGLCKAVSDNLRFIGEFAIFESAQVFFDRDYSSVYDKRESLPLQRRHVAGAFVAERDKYGDVFRRAKGAIEAMSRNIHIEPIILRQCDSSAKPFWADDTIWQTITTSDPASNPTNNAVKDGGDLAADNANISGGSAIGMLGLLSQKAAQGCGIKNAAVLLFELDIDALSPLLSRTNTFSHIPEYPMTEYDVSLLFDSSVKWEDIHNTACANRSSHMGKSAPQGSGQGSNLRGVSFVEEYKGKQIPDGKKSVTIRLLIGSPKKTLTSEEIESQAGATVKRLCKALGGELRA